MTTFSRRPKKRNLLDSLGARLGLLFLLFSCFISVPLFAASYTSARVGSGWIHLEKGDTASYTGTVRIGNEQPAWKTMLALDLSAFRFLDNPALPSEIDGNAATVIVGHYRPWGALWLGVGAGELRSYTRPAPDEHNPHGFFIRLFEIGMSAGIYESDFGRVELCTLYRQLRPESKWRKNTASSERIDHVLFELGLRLGNW